MFGKRPDGRLIRTLEPIQRVMPYIMKERNDAMNMFEEVILCKHMDEYIAKKAADGIEMDYTRIMLAAMVRILALRPQLNRFIMRGRVFARPKIWISFVVHRSFREEDAGTTVKLARALWIVPVTLFLSCFIAEREENSKRSIRIKIPWFIPCFLIAAAIVTWLPAAADAGKAVKDISKYLMITTLFLIGANLSREKLKQMGTKPVIHGIILWFILAAGWCFAIRMGWINCAG